MRHEPPLRRTSRGPLVCLVLALALLAACAGRRPPVLEALRQLEPKIPVVLIPGISGSQLVDRDTGRVVWGDGRSFFFPRDGGYRMALPLGTDSDSLEAPAAVTRVRILGLFKVDIYHSLVRLMESNGYRLGDIENPRPGDSFFLFPYDWRMSNDRTAAALVEWLDALRKARGEEVLTVHLICQSNAARIARYVLKYGGASLDEAEGGRASPPAWLEVPKLVLVGTANGGALRTLHDLGYPRTYLTLLGRKFQPEVAFTYHSVYEELPVYLSDLFFDEAGQPLQIDLYDAENWKRYGWAVYKPSVARRLAKTRRQDLFGTAESRHRFLTRALDHARRLHQLLRRDASGFGDTRYYLIQNDDLPTSARAMIVEEGGRRRTVFPEQEPLRRHPTLAERSTAQGDGHATLESQLWLSPQEEESLSRPPIFVPSVHRRIILHPETHRHLLELLRE